MAKIYKTYKYRMYPNTEQDSVLARYFGSVRFVNTDEKYISVR